MPSALVESDKPIGWEDYKPLTDESGKLTIRVSPKMNFRDNVILVEHFTYRGRDIFICRTALDEW